MRNEKKKLHSLKLTAEAPKNGWLEYYFPIGFRPIFRCYVSFREGSCLGYMGIFKNSGFYIFYPPKYSLFQGSGPYGMLGKGRALVGWNCLDFPLKIDMGISENRGKIPPKSSISIGLKERCGAIWSQG